MDFTGKTILIVEDEAILALTEKRWLEREGYSVKHVLTGETAVKLVNEDPDSIDLILMDIDLGRGMDGTVAAGIILKSHDIPILFLSSHTEKSIVKQTEEITNYGYVVKGSGETVLLASIKMAFKLFYSKMEALHNEQRLRKSEEKFRTLVENAPIPLTVARNGITLYTNIVYAKMFGFDNKEELLGKPLIEQVAPSSREFIINRLKRRAAGEIAIAEYEFTALRKSGEELPLLARTSLVELSEGPAIIAFFTDLSEIYRINRALKESEERLKLALEAGKIGFWDWNIFTGEVFRNEQWAEMLGYSSEEIQNTTKQWLDFIHPDDVEKVMQSVTDILEGRLKVHKMEYRMMTKAGNVKWIYDHSMVTDRDNDGKPVRMSGINTDITQRKLNEIRIGHYTEELKASNAVKDKLFSIISHDLKGPFTGFLGLTGELASSAESMKKEEITEIASIMHQSAEETYELLLNLLEWSRLQAGRFEFRPERLNLFSETEDIRKLFSSAAQHKSINIQNNMNQGLFVNTDKNALRTVLRNLVDNAIKFSQEGGDVLIGSLITDGSVQISVADSGTGISREALEKIFVAGSGFTTTGTKGEKGSGLGLALCQDLIRRCGGTIEVKSIENNGTEFTFFLPL